jgi:hypothetical protein
MTTRLYQKEAIVNSPKIQVHIIEILKKLKVATYNLHISNDIKQEIFILDHIEKRNLDIIF